MKRLSIISLVWPSMGFAQGQTRMLYFFGDNRVLQPEKPVQFWGWAPANSSFSVDFAGQKQDVKGQWKVTFPASSFRTQDY
ncbi:MAG: hypothetical protein QM669_13185 [Siphonobacter sp.]